jgi:hypothetical protein
MESLDCELAGDTAGIEPVLRLLPLNSAMDRDLFA